MELHWYVEPCIKVDVFKHVCLSAQVAKQDSIQPKTVF